MSALITISLLGIVSLFSGIYKMRNRSLWLIIPGILLAIGLALNDWNRPESLFSGMMEIHNYGVAFTITLLITGLMIFLMGFQHNKLEGNTIADIYGLMLFSIAGGIILVTYSNLVMLFLGIEILSIPLYILAGSKRKDLASNEASLKYFLMGSFASSFMLFGIALVFGACGSFNIYYIDAYLSSGNSSALITTGMLLISSGLIFKVAAAPFHFWAPDVYEGSPTMVTAFMATIVKTAGFAAFFKLFHVAFISAIADWNYIFVGIAALTLLIGNITALYQVGLKRLLAYSSISHAGYLFLGLLVSGSESANAVLYYTFAYSIGSIAAFAVLLAIKRQYGDDLLVSLKGLGKSNPLAAAALSISMLSLAGIPPFAGFFAKYFLFVLAVKDGYSWLVILAIICSIISVYYYLKVISFMYFKEDEERPALQFSLSHKLVMILCIIGSILVGILPHLITVL